MWGGDRIAWLYHRKETPEIAAESWEISDRSEGMSVSETGETLRELVERMGEDLIGRNRICSRFPLLVKLIDAREHLSIQVHPDDSMALQLGGEAKSELWHALAPSPVLIGLKKNLSEGFLRQSIAENILPDLLKRSMLQPGRSAYIPGGTAHALCAGSLILEVQQNSNTTYRLYDWGRVDRELHLEKGFRALRDLPHSSTRRVRNSYFSCASIAVKNSRSISLDDSTFQIFFCKEGRGLVFCDGKTEIFEKGQTILVAAKAQELTFFGDLSLFRISLPPPPHLNYT